MRDPWPFNLRGSACQGLTNGRVLCVGPTKFGVDSLVVSFRAHADRHTDATDQSDHLIHALSTADVGLITANTANCRIYTRPLAYLVYYGYISQIKRPLEVCFCLLQVMWWWWWWWCITLRHRTAVTPFDECIITFAAYYSVVAHQRKSHKIAPYWGGGVESRLTHGSMGSHDSTP